MNYIIFDLEYNQPFKINKKSKLIEKGYFNYRLSQEIIEIGAIKLDNYLNVIDSFRIFIKPQVYRYLHPTVKKLTDITLSDLEYAFTFDKVINYFQHWIGIEYILCSWGWGDIVEFKKNCDYHDIDTSWINDYIDIQYVYSTELGLGSYNQLGLINAASRLGIRINKDAHRALNDSLYAMNILKRLNVVDINKYIINAKSLNNRRLERINNINDKRVEKRKLKARCPECGRFLKTIHQWKARSSKIIHIGKCINCKKSIATYAELIVHLNGIINYKLKNKIVDDGKFEEF